MGVKDCKAQINKNKDVYSKHTFLESLPGMLNVLKTKKEDIIKMAVITKHLHHRWLIDYSKLVVK